MIYTVAWLEVHQKTVEANSKEEAIQVAQNKARPVDGSYYTILEQHTKVEHHNPAETIRRELANE